jgi:hypothetical protein
MSLVSEVLISHWKILCFCFCISSWVWIFIQESRVKRSADLLQLQYSWGWSYQFYCWKNMLARDKELCFFLQWSVIVRSILLCVELERQVICYLVGCCKKLEKTKKQNSRKCYPENQHAICYSFYTSRLTFSSSFSDWAPYGTGISKPGGSKTDKTPELMGDL